MSSPRAISRSLFEALFVRMLGGTLSAPVHEALVALGLDLSRPLAPAYPVEVLEAAVTVVLRDRYGPAFTREHERELGRLWVEGFFRTAVGRVLAGVTRLIGPGRYFTTLANHVRSVATSRPPSTRQLGPTHFQLLLDDPSPWPGVVEGAFERALEMAGAANVTVRLIGTEGPDRVYEAKW